MRQIGTAENAELGDAMFDKCECDAVLSSGDEAAGAVDRIKDPCSVWGGTGMGGEVDGGKDGVWMEVCGSGDGGEKGWVGTEGGAGFFGDEIVGGEFGVEDGDY